MITGIKLRHFKSHESTELDFTSGTNLIIGQMGSGKTSIIDGLCFALFGTFPSLKSRRVTLDDVVMARPTKYTEASVEVKFTAHDANYSVERVYRKGEALAYLRSGGQIIEAGPQRVTEAVERLIQADYELFTRAVYSEQNKLDWFLSLGKGERKKYFDELLGISRFETARSTATAVLNRLKTLEATKKSYVTGADTQSSKDEFQKLNEVCAKLTSSLQTCKKELETALSEHKTFGELVLSLEEKEKAFRDNTQKAASAHAAVAELETLISASKKEIGKEFTAKELQERKLEVGLKLKQCRELKERLAVSRNANQNTQGELQQAESELKRLAQYSEDDEARIEAELVELASSQSKNDDALKTQLTLLASAKQAAGRSDAWLKESKSVESEISALLLQIQETQKQDETGEEPLKAEVEAIREKLAKANETISRCSESLHILSADHTQCPVCHSALRKEDSQLLHKQAGEEKSAAENVLVHLKESLLAAQVRLQKAVDNKTRKASLEDSLEKARQRQQKIASELQIAQKESVSMNETEKKVSQLQSTISTISKQRMAESQKVVGAKEFKRLHKLSASLRDELALTASIVNQLVAQLVPLDENALVLETAMLERAGQALEWAAKATALSLLKAKAAEEIVKLGFSEVELKEARTAASEAAGRKAKYSSEEKSVSRELEEKRRRLAELEVKLKELEAALARIKELETVESGVHKLQNALEETQGALRTDLVASLNEASAALWKSIYPYGDYPNLRMIATEDDYSLELQALDGTWMAIESASGGERVCAALCLRVSLALVLSPKLSVIILDEPTHNMDSTAVGVLSRALHDELPKFINQTFLITHDESLKESASSRIYLVDRDKDAGDKSIVEQLSTE